MKSSAAIKTLVTVADAAVYAELHIIYTSRPTSLEKLWFTKIW